MLRRAPLRVLACLLAAGAVRAAPLPAAGLTEVETRRLDDRGTYYSTFQTHARKVIATAQGVFLAYVRAPSGALTQFDPTGRTWRLMRSVDGGASYAIVFEEPAPDDARPPSLEVGADGSLYALVAQPPLASYLYRFTPADDFRQPIRLRLPQAPLGGQKYSMTITPDRQRILSFNPFTPQFVRLDLTGTTLFSSDLFVRNGHQTAQYPTPQFDERGRLHVSWQNGSNSVWKYPDTRYMYSDDEGTTWRKLDGSPLPAPFSDDTDTPATKVSLDSEQDHQNLGGMWARGGLVHFLLGMRPQHPSFAGQYNHYVRFDTLTGRRDLDRVPFTGELLSLTNLDGGFIGRLDRPGTTLYAVGASQGHLVCLASDDDGASWYDYAVSPADFGPGDYSTYSISLARELTDDGWICGAFTHFTAPPAEVYSFRIRAGLATAQLDSVDRRGTRLSLRCGATRGQPREVRFWRGERLLSDWQTFGPSVTLDTATAPTHYQLRSALGVESRAHLLPPVPDHLAFRDGPTTLTAGVPLSPAPTVEVRDPWDHLVAVDGLAIRLTVDGAALSGPVEARTVGGVATFPGLSVDHDGPGVALRAEALGLTSTTMPPAPTGPTTTPGSVWLAPGLYNLGLPWRPDHPDPATVLGSGRWQLWRYDAAVKRFAAFGAGAVDAAQYVFQPGRGLWVFVGEGTTLTAPGVLGPEQSFDLPLERGWNNVANPFNADLPWNAAAIRVRTADTDLGSLTEAADAGRIVPYAWVFDASRRRYDLVADGLPQVAVDRLPRLAGFWVYARQDGLVLRLPTPADAARARRAALPGWAVLLRAAQGEQQATVLIGQSRGTARRSPAPPSLAEPSLRLELVGPDGRAQVDLEPAAGARSWTLAATAASLEPITLSWPSLGRSLPTPGSLTLTDLQTRSVVRLSGRAGYTWRPGRAGEERRFRLDLSPARGASPLAALCVTPTRTRGANIAVSLTTPATVTVSVTGLAGRLIWRRELALPAGTSAVGWDGRDGEGRPVPWGSYQVTASASAVDGAAGRLSRVAPIAR